ncbi:uncharacterized protein si:ch211-217g15.3 [Erpetoichthys calabaricus]|uniref:uncharacterized protein si:ch211-217g15.3 n=1 Tax=Erpetoichthys calabaricus TaxID=27687 RepID=UPI002234624A|nr:uncharacterized protein si:ch211-217g15.3 [Erpetoichthys calabaricus]
MKLHGFNAKTPLESIEIEPPEETDRNSIDSDLRNWGPSKISKPRKYQAAEMDRDGIFHNFPNEQQEEELQITEEFIITKNRNQMRDTKAEEDQDQIYHSFPNSPKAIQVISAIISEQSERLIPQQFERLFAKAMMEPEEDQDYLYHSSIDDAKMNPPSRMVEPQYEIMEGPEEDRDHIYHQF